MMEPCPFCGSKDIVLVDAAKPLCWLSCKDCMCFGPLMTEGSQAAIEAWNTRIKEDV